MIGTTVEPDAVSRRISLGRWKVVIFNNETNTVEEVMDILMRATGCDVEEAEIETWEAHTFGKADVHFAERTECDRAATLISSIGVKTEVAREWAEG